MYKYTALLRGINVGGNNKVDMKILKTAFEELGYTSVSTYINSGNVIFETKSKDQSLLQIDIETKIKNIFGFVIKVIIRSAENLNMICKNIPMDWTDDTIFRTYVLFPGKEFDNRETLKLLNTEPTVDKLLYLPGVIVWNMNKGSYTKSGMKDLIGTSLYKNMTVRNINTVRKLNTLLK